MSIITGTRGKDGLWMKFNFKEMDMTFVYILLLLPTILQPLIVKILERPRRLFIVLPLVVGCGLLTVLVCNRYLSLEQEPQTILQADIPRENVISWALPILPTDTTTVEGYSLEGWFGSTIIL